LQISIIGDSWGEPNWRFPIPNYSADGHLSQRLFRAGHRVYNSSRAGGSNLNTWSAALEQPAHRDSDLVIWFHTEITRDMRPPHLNWRYEEELSQVAHTVYRKCRDSFKALFPKAQLWVIEGQAPTVKPHFYQWFNPRFYTPDWRSELIGINLPPTQLVGSLSREDFFKGSADSIKDRSKWTGEVEHILKRMRECNYFTDDCHPNDRAHEQLFQRAEEIIQECILEPTSHKQIQEQAK
jgi:hypothetical protein